MSRENVDRLREIIERLNRKDIPGVLRLMDPEIRFEHRVAEMPYTVVAKFRNGLVTDFTDYGDRERALEAAGLTE